jgi:thioredoxin-related protein
MAEPRLSYAIDNDLNYKQFFKELDKSDTGLETPADKKPWTYRNMDISAAMELSKSAKKPLILFFTCHACVNALKMEDYVLNNYKIRPELDQRFIFAALYVDDKTPTEEATYRNLGQKNLALQKEKFKTDTQPFFAILDENGSVLRTHGYTDKVDVFLAFLNKAE